MSIGAPQVSVRDGQLYADAFDDIYFSPQDGLAETRHVFLRHSGFLNKIEEQDALCVLECGFGTGLNFLACWQAWQQRGRRCDGWLQYTSVEKYPLAAEQIRAALSAWPELHEAVEVFLAQYPPRRSGIYRLRFDEAKIALTLCFGEAVTVLQQLTLRADCIFLDGFAPQRNPDMWSDDLCAALAVCSHSDTRLSTFTAAGVVRRGLAAHGFHVEKVPGFGRKREMITAVFSGPATETAREPYFALPEAEAGTGVRRLAVIGGGLAGCSIAWHAAQRGIAVDIYDAQGIAAGASGNHAGICGPNITADDSPFAAYYFSAWHYARHLFAYLKKHSGLDIYFPCGTTHVLHDAALRRRGRRLIEQCCQLDDWAELDDEVDDEGAQLRISGAMLVSPRLLCQAYIDSAHITVHQHAINRCSRDDGSWHLYDAGGARSGSADAVVFANAQSALAFEQCCALELQSVRGQLHYLQHEIEVAGIVQAEAYLTPLWQGKQVLGATFQRDDQEAALRESDQEHLIAQAQAELHLSVRADSLHGRVGFRSCGPDRMPLVGPLIDVGDFQQRFADLRHGRALREYAPASYLSGAYVSLGHGSRGIAGSAWAASILIDQLMSEASACSWDVWKAIAPQRFLIRTLKRAAQPT